VRLENVLALTHGSLMSQPSISIFDDIVIEASRVKRGSLFIAINAEDIDIALSNGAYGIVFDREIDVSDNENAWIKVDDIYDALKRITRFLLIDKELDAFTCKDIVLQVAKELITPNNFIILEGTLSENFSKLLSAPVKSTLLFKDTQIQSNVFTNISHLSDNVENKIEIIEQTLFETAFIYKGVFYERQLISAFFIPYLEQILNLLSTKNIDFKIKAFTNMPHFKAQFINKSLHVRDFGSTNRVVIFEDNLDLVQKQIAFISKHAPWAKLISLIPIGYALEDKSAVFYNSQEEAVKILKESDFNFVLAVKLDVSIFDTIDNYPKQQSLF
jgi:ferrochelatase